MSDNLTKYPISNLDSASLNLQDLLEIVTDDYGNKSYVNKKITVESFFDFLVSSHAIFNKIDDVFNDKSIVDINEITNEEEYRYISSAYISGQTYFQNNPYTNNNTIYNELKINETVKKQQLEKYIHDKCLEIRPLKTEDTAVQYTENGWYKSINDKENPRIDLLTFEEFAKPNLNCKIKNEPNPNGIPFWHSGPISIFSNAWATIFGKVKYKKNAWSAPYTLPDLGKWVGIVTGDENNTRLIAISELHNFDKNDIAYFSFQLPLNRNTNYYVVLPFKPLDVSESNITENTSTNSTNNKYKLFQVTDDMMYVLIDDEILESYPIDKIPAKILDTIAIEDFQKNTKTYDIFSNIPVNSAAIIYYSEVAKDTEELNIKWD